MDRVRRADRADDADGDDDDATGRSSATPPPGHPRDRRGRPRGRREKTGQIEGGPSSEIHSAPMSSSLHSLAECVCGGGRRTSGSVVVCGRSCACTTLTPPWPKRGFHMRYRKNAVTSMNASTAKGVERKHRTCASVGVGRARDRGNGETRWNDGPSRCARSRSRGSD